MAKTDRNGYTIVRSVKDFVVYPAPSSMENHEPFRTTLNKNKCCDFPSILLLIPTCWFGNKIMDLGCQIKKSRNLDRNAKSNGRRNHKEQPAKRKKAKWMLVSVANTRCRVYNVNCTYPHVSCGRDARLSSF